jgi:formylglycine-generating enzyme required for sulfatase activity
MGSPRGEEGRDGGVQNRKETLHQQRIGRKFALAAHEVTVDQFLELKPCRPVNMQ